MEHQVYLALGTNLGDRLLNLSNAVHALSKLINIRKISSVYETEPWGYSEQPCFLNMVLLVETNLQPLDLLVQIKNLENDLGRTPNFRYGPRLIDIDILLFDDLIFNSENLSIPHKEMTRRSFVLFPLHEISPKVLIPGTERNVEEWIKMLPPDEIKIFSTLDMNNDSFHLKRTENEKSEN